MTENPLLDETHSFDIPFDRVRAEHIEPAIDALVADAQRRVDAIATAPRTHAHTLDALEKATEKLEVAITVAGHLESVATTPEIRAAYEVAQPKSSAFFSKLPLNAPLFAALSEFAATEEASRLDPVTARSLQKTLDAYRREGAELDEAGKARLEEIDVALTKKTTLFSQHVLDDTNAFELVVTDEAKLAGLPASARAGARQSAQAKGVEGWRFTLQGPSYMAVMLYLDDAEIREKVWRAYNARASRGENDNRALVCEILALRKAKAELLGFADFADFVLDDRMAKTGEKAADFVADLHARTMPAFERETAELEAFRREVSGDDTPLRPWDLGYYAEKMRKARFDFDDEILRPYFSVGSVLDGLFEVARRLYGVEVRKRSAPTWDESVACFGVYEGERMIATFYVDLYPRENKRGGAWMNGLMYGATPEHPHVGLFCANVSPPLGDAPALLTHGEVETLFHEFGHLLHHALSVVPVRSLGGTNVAWDFVELPSQIMENFCWERSSLDLFARHHETGEPIPEALFQKLRATRTFRAASAQMRQLGFGAVDLRLHREFDPAQGPDALIAFAREILEAHSSVPYDDDYAMICGFTHLFASPTGYAAAYYSYKWAEVLDADAFTRFLEADVLSAEVGRAFRDTILSRGDSDDPAILFRTFMGRDPNLDALLTRSGLSH